MIKNIFEISAIPILIFGGIAICIWLSQFWLWGAFCISLGVIRLFWDSAGKFRLVLIAGCVGFFLAALFLQTGMLKQ